MINSSVRGRGHASNSALLAAAVSAFLGSAVAAEGGATPMTLSTHVSFADLDLSTTDGVEAARERVRHTARLLCTRLSDTDDLSRKHLSRQPNYDACINDAMGRTLPRVLEAARRLSAVSVVNNQSK